MLVGVKLGNCRSGRRNYSHFSFLLRPSTLSTTTSLYGAGYLVDKKPVFAIPAGLLSQKGDGRRQTSYLPIWAISPILTPELEEQKGRSRNIEGWERLFIDDSTKVDNMVLQQTITRHDELVKYASS
jgi:hypothetical protein